MPTVTRTGVDSAIGAENLPTDVRGLTSLDRVDYADHFRVPAAPEAEKTAEEWARDLLERTPLGRSAPSLWRLLGLRLGPTGSAGHVQGWRIDDRGSDWVRLQTRSPVMTAQAVVRHADGTVSLTLFLRFDRLAARLVWLPVGVMHRRAVPTMLRQAMSGRDASEAARSSPDPDAGS